MTLSWLILAFFSLTLSWLVLTFFFDFRLSNFSIHILAGIRYVGNTVPQRYTIRSITKLENAAWTFLKPFLGGRHTVEVMETNRSKWRMRLLAGLIVKALLDWKESGIFDCWTGKTEKSNEIVGESWERTRKDGDTKINHPANQFHHTPFFTYPTIPENWFSQPEQARSAGSGM